MALPKGSERLGAMRASQDLSKVLRFFASPLSAPAKTTACATPNSRARPSNSAFMWPSPTKTNLASPRASRINGTASINKSGPRCDARRPKNKNIGASGSMPSSFFASPDHSGFHSFARSASACIPVWMMLVPEGSPGAEKSDTTRSAAARPRSSMAAGWLPSSQPSAVKTRARVAAPSRVAASRKRSMAEPSNQQCACATSKAPCLASQAKIASAMAVQKSSTCRRKSECIGDTTSWYVTPSTSRWRSSAPAALVKMCTLWPASCNARASSATCAAGEAVGEDVEEEAPPPPTPPLQSSPSGEASHANKATRNGRREIKPCSEPSMQKTLRPRSLPPIPTWPPLGDISRTSSSKLQPFFDPPSTVPSPLPTNARAAAKVADEECTG
mmetsp:Transcript_13328/g.36562  ORF Transcript_13328/g.36562 Transcript_13328/m.36562 type:complete len:387 (+) Transcript_13328:395-1555(+)